MCLSRLRSVYLEPKGLRTALDVDNSYPGHAGMGPGDGQYQKGLYGDVLLALYNAGLARTHGPMTRLTTARFYD